MPDSEIGTIYATWTDPTGTVWSLTDITDTSHWFTRPEVSGWGAVPVEYTLDPLPRGGHDVRFIRTESARLTWPLHIWGETHVEFVEKYRSLRRAFLMTALRGLPGVLRVARPDGTAREIDAYYEDGFRGEANENWLSANPVLTLLCPDGFWRDATSTVYTRTSGSAVSFLAPLVTISSAQVLGDTVLTNPGDVDAWPEWTITGPMTELTATNNTSGLAFTLTHTRTAGQQITITTQRPSVRGPGDTNLVGALDWPAAYLWGLMPGDNDVEFLVAGGGSGTTIQIEFFPRYEGA